MLKSLEKKDILRVIEEMAEDAEISIGAQETEEMAVDAEISIEAQETEEMAEDAEISIGAQETEEMAEDAEISIGAQETEEMEGKLSLIMTGTVQSVTIQTFHSVKNVIAVENLAREAVEAIETVAVEISTEVQETEEMAVDAEISTEVLEVEIISKMVIGIVLSAIILTLQDVLNAIDVVSQDLEVVAVEKEVEEISIEAQETEEMAEDAEILIEVQETEEMVEAVQIEENSLTVTIIEANRKKIISENPRVKGLAMLITMHQNLLFHANLDEIVMIK